MPSHASESLLYGASFSTPEFLGIFNDNMRVQAWYDVEVALAKAQSKLGIIPTEAYEEIARKAYVENVDVQKLAMALVKQRTPLCLLFAL